MRAMTRLRRGVWRVLVCAGAVTLPAAASELASKPPSAATRAQPHSTRIASKTLADQQLLPNPFLQVLEGFGVAVAVDGDLALISATEALDMAGVTAGVVYAFERENGEWRQTQTLRPADPADAFARFGLALALQGTRAVVGVPGGDASVQQGYALVYVRANSQWAEEARLMASDGASRDEFGIDVAIDGDSVVVGASHASSLEVRRKGTTTDPTGAAYVYRRNGSAWTQQAKLLASDGQADDGFGRSVSIAGDTLLVGAPDDSTGSIGGHGSAYVFQRAASAWSQHAKLLATDRDQGDRFGTQVELRGDTALIGSPGDTIGLNEYQGSAYVHVRNAGTWSFQAKLVNADGRPIDRSFEAAGLSLALDGNVALVGAPGVDGAREDSGAVLVYERIGSAWQRREPVANPSDTLLGFGYAVAMSQDAAFTTAAQRCKGVDCGPSMAQAWTRNGDELSAPREVRGSEANFDQFGWGVAVQGDRALVGAPFASRQDEDARGSACFYARAGVAWQLQQCVRDHLSPGRSLFGVRVALHGDRAFIAAIGGGIDAGAVYVYRYAAATWTLEATLSAGTTAADNFGIALAAGDDRVLVGQLPVPVESAPGIVAVFERNAAGWQRTATLFAPAAEAGDEFGSSIAMAGDRVLIGAPRFETPTTQAGVAGAAYLFARQQGQWLHELGFGGSEAMQDRYCGAAVALVDDALAIGCSGSSVANDEYHGRVHVSSRNGATWTPLRTLDTTIHGRSAQFGHALGLSEEVLLVGAPGADDPNLGPYTGAVVRYARTNDTWVEAERTFGPARDSEYAASLAWDGHSAFIGAPRHSNVASLQQPGAVFVAHDLGDRLFRHGFEATAPSRR
jgi:hypothetical protein